MAISFIGSTSQTVGGTPAVFQINSMSINNAAGVILNCDVEIYSGTISLLNGNLNNGTHLVFDASENIVRSAGTLGTAPSFVSGINVTYTGNVTTGNELPSGPFNLGNLTINTSGTVTLGADATANGVLTFTSGKLALGSHNLTMGSSPGTISGANSSTYVVTNGTGSLVQNVGSSDVTYPIGTASAYNQVVLNNTGGTADNYSVLVASGTTDRKSVV